MTTIGERLKALIGQVISERGRFKTLEELTEIKEQHWKNWWYGQQRPYELMIQAIARLWPEYALWLVCGIDDPETGQFSANEITPSIANRTYAGRYLRRKVEFDEIFQLTMGLSLLPKSEGQQEELSEDSIRKLAENFIAMLRQASDSEISIDYENLDLTGAYKQAIAKDKLLKKLSKERREELREYDRKKK